MLKILGETHRGRVRAMNQDAFAYGIVGENCGYAIVCDGMGGENAGEVASSTACKLIESFFSRDLKEDISESSVKAIMFSAISAANAKIYSMSNENKEYSGMGTTVVAAVVIGHDAHIVHVGDSRLYLTDQTRAVQMTRDHSVVQNKLNRGEITKEEALTHPERHKITRAVGVSSTLDVDYQMFELKSEYCMLLCTDGLSNYASPEVLAELVQRSIAENSARALMDYANGQGGSDNITAVVLFQE